MTDDLVKRLRDVNQKPDEDVMTEDYEEVIAVNLDAGVALTNKDRVIWLTDFIGSDGESCAEEDAVAAVGFDEAEENRWWAINLVAFTTVRTQ